MFSLNNSKEPLGVSVAIQTGGLKGIITEAQDKTASAYALREGIKIINRAAKAFAPRKLKHLYRAQGTKAKKGNKTKTGAFAVQGAKTKYKKLVKAGRRSQTGMRRIIPAKYDHLVIGGTRPHSIRKGTRLERTVKRKGKEKLLRAIGQGVGKPHPGGRPNPYRQRAYNSVKRQVARVVLAAYGKKLQMMFAKAEAKLKGKR